MPETNLGTSRVTVKYSTDSEQAIKIQQIRDMSAELINFLEIHKQSRLAMDGEIARVYANAMTEIEGACMWAIKAICK